MTVMADVGGTRIPPPWSTVTEIRFYSIRTYDVEVDAPADGFRVDDLTLVGPCVFRPGLLDHQVPVRDGPRPLRMLQHQVRILHPRVSADGQEVLVAHAPPRHLQGGDN